MFTTAIVWISSSVNPASSRRVGHQREAVLDRWVRELAEIGREDVPRRARGADRREGLLPRHLAGVDRREAPLEDRALVGKHDLVGDRHALGRVVRMRDQHVRDACRERLLDRHRDLGPAEMPGCDDQLMACDDPEHRLEGRGRDRYRPARHPRGDELVLNLSPDRLLRRLRPVLARLVLRVDRRQPDDARPAPRRDLHRLRVQPTDTRVERDRTESIDSRHGRAHDGSALGRRHVVRLEHEPRQPELGEPVRERQVVDPPLCEIRVDVDVEVVRAADELARTRRRLSAGRRQAAHPPRAPRASP